MSLVSFTPVTDGSTATAASVNTPLSTIYNDYNGNITNANIAANAAIAISKVSTDALLPQLKNPYKFRVYTTSASSTSGGSFTRVLFDTREYDTGSNVDISSTKGRFTAPIAGFYSFAASCGGSISGSTQFAIALYKNGAVHTPGSSISTTAATTTATSYITVADTIQLAANDTVDVMVFLNGTIGLASGANGTFFTGFLLSQT